MRVAALEQDVGFGAYDEEGRAEREDVKALEIQVAAVDDVQRPGDGDQGLCKIREDPPIAQLVGVRQSRACDLTPKSHVVQLAPDRGQARLNIAQTFAISKLSEAHRQKLVPTGKALLL